MTIPFPLAPVCGRVSGGGYRGLARWVGMMAVFLGVLQGSPLWGQTAAERYFPLNDGDQRTFSARGETLSERVGQTWFGGRTAFTLSPDDGGLMYLAHRNGELLMLAVRDLGVTVEFDPPLVFLDSALATSGGRRTTRAALVVRGSPLPDASATLSITVASAGSVTVPVGRYDNCRRLDIQLTAEADGERETLSSQAFILAPDFGPIRESVLDADLNFAFWADLVSGVFRGQVIQAPAAPLIVQQPSPANRQVGQPAGFSVSASGFPPPSYQWQRRSAGGSTWVDLVDGGGYSGSRTAALEIAAVALAQNGDQFRCVVRNSAGSATSNPATLTVSPPPAVAPSITAQPQSRTVQQGQAVSFTVVAAGTAPLAYQWRRNGTAINGATGASHSIGSAAKSDEGTYTVVVSNSAGSVTSSAATLTVQVPVVAPAITGQPQSKTVDLGQPALFGVAASGSEPLSYQWRRNGTNIPGATLATHVIAAVTAGDAGEYSARVSNPAGAVTSAVAVLTVRMPAEPPVITGQPRSKTVDLGQGTLFGVAATGTGPLNYQWRKDGTNISGATSANYVIPAVARSDEGGYSAVVWNSAGSATSVVAFLTVRVPVQPPSITGQPRSKAVEQGQATLFGVTAAGTEPLQYQWQKDGVDIPGATEPTYHLPAVRRTDAGVYQAIVSNAAGEARSVQAWLVVRFPGLGQRVDRIGVEPDGTLTLELPVEPGVEYELLESTDLRNWAVRERFQAVTPIMRRNVGRPADRPGFLSLRPRGP